MTLTAEQHTTFANDGVVKIERAVEPAFVEEINALAQRQLDTPGPWVSDTNPGSTTDRLFTTRYLWQDEPESGRFVRESGVASIAAEPLSA